ncbi:hypothetical protein HOP50_06g41320 [Chloropicon primus]|uniref:Uncharacterized protein n=2 Tax=Chloropicon primus TaxID=1764295 RepID=A0A5B8MPT1_9CHLO|nr:hypothetical protein A3770_06p41230 [Chloropicon primus]UPR00816.1 hypothetical protein HOP50_06g41320 [Chloropicon primus]|eukprot:QDZ21605.1 hypothetical protein A3770_06p41230 [Chloropicon primus]
MARGKVVTRSAKGGRGGKAGGRSAALPPLTVHPRLPGRGAERKRVVAARGDDQEETRRILEWREGESPSSSSSLSSSASRREAVRALCTSVCVLSSAGLAPRARAAGTPDERRRSSKRRAGKGKENVTVAHLSTGGAAVSSLRPLAFVATAIAAVSSASPKVQNFFSSGKRSDSTATQAKAVAGDEARSGGVQSMSSAAAAAAAEAAKAAGHATAVATMATRERESESSEGIIALEEVASCLDAALESSSQQTELAVLDVSETLMARLEAKDEEIKSLRERIVTSKEVSESVREIRESTNKKLAELFADIEKLRAKLKDIVAQRDEAQAKVVALEQREADLQQQMETSSDDADASKEVLQATIADLQLQLDAKAEEVRALDERAESYLSKSQRLEGEVSDLRGQLGGVAEMKDKLEAATSAGDEARLQVSSLEQKESELQEKVDSLSTEIEKMRSSSSVSEASLQATVKALERQLESKSSELEEAQSSVEELQSSAEELRHQAEAEALSAERADSEAASLQRLLQEMEEANARLEAEAGDSSAEREESQARLASLEQREGELLQQLEKVTADHESMVTESTSRASLEAKIADLEQQLESKSSEAVDAKAKADKGHELLFESNQDRNRLQKLLEDETKLAGDRQLAWVEKGKELESALLVVADLKKHLSVTHDKNVELESACASMQEKLEANNNNLDRELQEREKEVKEMNGLLVRLKHSSDQVEKLKSQLMQVHSDYALHKTTAEEVKTELQAEVDNLQTLLDSSSKGGEYSEDDLKALKVDNEEKESTIERLTLRLSQSEALVQDLESKSSNLEETNSKYELTVSELEEQIQGLDERLKKDAGRMKELDTMKAQIASHSSEVEEMENLREYIRQQQLQLKAKDGSAKMLTSLIKDIHALTSQLSP